MSFLTSRHARRETRYWVSTDKAPTSSKSYACTKVSLSDSTVTRELILEVLDTPGLIDTNRTAEELRNTFLNFMRMTNPGPHAFLLILKMKHVTDQKKKDPIYLAIIVLIKTGSLGSLCFI